MISVVVINHNTPGITRECIKRLQSSQGVGLEIILINNTPVDKFDDLTNIKVIKNKKALGFGANNNIGMRLAKGDKILLLNSDAMVFPDTLKLCNEQSFDILGCKLLNQDLTLQPSWGYFPTLRRIFQFQFFVDNFPIIRKFSDSIHIRAISRFTKTQPVDWVMGAFMLMKRGVFEKTGGFDENFHMYGEELEFLYRAKKLGFQTWYYPDATCIHLQGQSTKSLAKMFLGEAKGYIYWFKKYNSLAEQFFLKIILLLGCLIRIPAWAVWGKWDLVKAYSQMLPSLAAQIFPRTK